VETNESDKLILDSREPIDIQNEAKQHFKDVTIAYLEAGDLFFPDKSIMIERKEIEDFVGSIRGEGRVFKQAYKMNMNCKHSYVIIIGSMERVYKNKYINFNEEEFVGACASLMSKHNVQVFWARNRRQFWKISKKIYEKTNEDCNAPVELKKIIPRFDDAYVGMLCQVPNLGEKRAKEILKSYKVWELFDITEKDLRQIDGIGPKMALNIKKIFKR
jgi:ERCC4-type nuclease